MYYIYIQTTFISTQTVFMYTNHFYIGKYFCIEKAFYKGNHFLLRIGLALPGIGFLQFLFNLIHNFKVL